MWSRSLFCTLLLFALPLPAAAQAPPATISKPSFLTDPPNPRDLEITTDAPRVVTQIVGPAGATVSVTTAEGATFALEIPKDALSMPIRISLTPLASTKGLPPGDAVSYGVDMQPSGLYFNVPAKLIVTPPAAVAKNPVIGLAFDEGGTDAQLYPWLPRERTLCCSEDCRSRA